MLSGQLPLEQQLFAHAGLALETIMKDPKYDPNDAAFLFNGNSKRKMAEVMRTLSYIVLPLGWVLVVLWDSCQCG